MNSIVTVFLVDDDFEEVPEKKKELKFETVSKDKMPVAPVYVIEYFLGACLAGYILNYILGRVSNGTLAQRWFDAAESFLVSFLNNFESDFRIGRNY